MAIEDFGGSVGGLEVYGTDGDLTDGAQPSQSEVTKRRLVKLREEDAFRIDISVQHPLAVCTVERPGNLDAERDPHLAGKMGPLRSLEAAVASQYSSTRTGFPRSSSESGEA